MWGQAVARPEISKILATRNKDTRVITQIGDRGVKTDMSEHLAQVGFRVAQCSQDTAYRDILDLMEKGVLKKIPEVPSCFSTVFYS